MGIGSSVAKVSRKQEDSGYVTCCTGKVQVTTQSLSSSSREPLARPAGGPGGPASAVLCCSGTLSRPRHSFNALKWVCIREAASSQPDSQEVEVCQSGLRVRFSHHRANQNAGTGRAGAPCRRRMVSKRRLGLHRQFLLSSQG